MITLPSIAATWAVRHPLTLALLAFTFAVGCCCGCTRRVDTAATVHEAVAEVQDTTAAREVVSHVVEAAGRETVTVEEYAPASTPPIANTARSGGVKPGESPLLPHPEPAFSPVLLRRTITVKDVGPITRDTRSDSQRATETHETEATDSKATSHTETRTGPSPFFWLALGSGVCVGAGLLWRFRGVVGLV